ncbi:hypothetical protein [uncultured Tateyamaria sp.]|uniref:calcium-binding protein n=1 Tax=uncultured Tateyamaria sp. TaxID=455651 RepID=UPI0026236C8E|nr:hypothetical protein [uncultured Tateyamaria sp.]
MVGILALLGFGLLVGGLSGLGGDDDPVAEPVDDGVEPTQVASEGDDPLQFVGDAYVDDFQAGLDDLVSEGELTQAQADALFDNTASASGPLNIVTGDGEDGILGGDQDDTISVGGGDDGAAGGEGDDLIELGAGADVSGESDRTGSFPDDNRPFVQSDAGVATAAVLEAGNDTIRGGGGADDIADAYGSNELRGENGDDFIVAVDSDGVTPDVVRGGTGSDALIVDQGDTVNTGVGQDFVTVDVTSGVEEGYQLVTIEDFDPANDRLELEGEDSLLNGTGAGVTVEPFDGGVTVLVNGVEVVRVVGGTGLTPQDIFLQTA